MKKGNDLSCSLINSSIYPVGHRQLRSASTAVNRLWHVGSSDCHDLHPD